MVKHRNFTRKVYCINYLFNITDGVKYLNYRKRRLATKGEESSGELVVRYNVR